MSAARPPAPPAPRLPTSIIDAPTQRLYTVSLLLLLSAYKASDALAHSRLLNDTPESINTVLLKWVAIDLAVVSFVSWLRIPRLDWDWKGRWAARVALVALDWLLFGRWTVRTSLPTFRPRADFLHETVCDRFPPPFFRQEPARTSTVDNRELGATEFGVR